MTKSEKLQSLALQTTALANEIMQNPETNDADFRDAFRARDRAFVESLEMSADQIAEARWETMCGCNGSDSPFHSYFGMESDSDRDFDNMLGS